MRTIETLPEGYVLQQIGVSALRNADGTFRPSVPVFILVPSAHAIRAEEALIEDGARLFGKMFQKTMEVRYEELTGEPAQLPEELQ